LTGSDAGAFAIVAIAGALVSGNGPYTHLAIALLHRLFGFTAGKWLAGLVGLGVAAFTYRRFLPLGLVGFLLSVTLTTFSIFLFGSQAFCNYTWCRSSVSFGSPFMLEAGRTHNRPGGNRAFLCDLPWWTAGGPTPRPPRCERPLV
jgi:hypothetical protein